MGPTKVNRNEVLYAVQAIQTIPWESWDEENYPTVLGEIHHIIELVLGDDIG